MTSVSDCWTHYQTHVGTTVNPEANARYWGRLCWFASKDPDDPSFPMEVDGYIRSRQVAAATLNRELALLRAALRMAERDGLIKTKPLIRHVAGASPRLRALTKDEAGRMVRAADKGTWQEQVYVRLALGTGSRPGAIVDRKWEHVAKDAIDFRTAGPGSTRMKKRVVVPINDMVKAALKIAAKNRSGDYVLQHDGVRFSSPRRMVTRIADRAGIHDVSPHVLRHTVASILLQEGVGLLEVSRLLGHADTRVTEKVYFQNEPAWLTPTTKLLDF